MPRKNIKPINGKPLIAYTIQEALKSKFIDKYIVSTDDVEIQEVALAFGASAPFLRPDDISSDIASSVAALQHAVTWIENADGLRYDYVIELMCTNPTKTVEDIDACIDLLLRTDADSVIAVHKLEDHHPIRIKKIVDGRIVDFCLEEPLESRRQDLKPDAFIRSGSIYALKRDHLMEDNQRYGSSKSMAYILPENRAVNVDTEIDFKIAEILLSS